ncbi:MAG: alpha/beta fold hydrolase [Calditrichaeota bacterium]|nr:MAG: alpha/beta fold hydrolase [Calditrichota bacterium]
MSYNGRLKNPKQEFWKKVDRLLFVALNLMILLTAAVFVYARFADARAYDDYPANGRLVDVGRRNVFFFGMGSQNPGPAIVLIANRGDDSGIWQAVQPALAEEARVWAYDRAGYLWSDPGPEPMTAGQIAEDLHAGLLALGEKQVILVAHGAGNLPLFLYLQKFRHQPEVKGVVLLQPLPLVHSQIERLAETAGFKMPSWRKALLQLVIKLGFGRVYADIMGWSSPQVIFPQRIHDLVNWDYARQASRMRYSQTNLLARLQERSFSVLEKDFKMASTVAWPRNLPLTILQAGAKHTGDGIQANSDVFDLPESMRWLKSLAEQSDSGKLIRVSHSSAYIQIDQPAVVIQTIEEMWKAVSRQKAAGGPGRRG